VSKNIGFQSYMVIPAHAERQRPRVFVGIEPFGASRSRAFHAVMELQLPSRQGDESLRRLLLPAGISAILSIPSTSSDQMEQAANTYGQFAPLTDIERDALGELSNIAMARAANSLRQMVEHQVMLSVPSVDIVSKEKATQLIANPNTPTLVAIRQDFSGAFSGRALLIFPEASSFELVRIVVGQHLPLEDIGNLEDEALAETGNIILNSWVATIANLLKSGLKMSLPTVVRGDSGQMFRSGESQNLVLFLQINFEISTKEVRGYVALLMDIPSVEELRSLIADFISNATRTRDPD
jgi:chemotaxis protein CheC